MTQDLVTQILQGLGPTEMDQVSAAAGIDNQTARKAVGGVVPAILAGLAGIVSRPGGGDLLSSAIGQIGKLGMPEAGVRSIAQDKREALMEKGSSLLSSLFGGQGVEGIIAAVAQYLGLDQGTASKLLGFLTPLVLSFLGRQAQASGGSSGLARMLTDQKDAIASALPSGLVSRLQGSGLLSGIAGNLGQGAASAAAAARSSTAAVGQGIGAASSKASGLGAKAGQSARSYGWLYGGAAAVVLAIFAYWLWGTSAVQEANRPAATSAQTEGSGTSTAVGRIDLGPQLTITFDKTRSVLQQVNDPESAKKALPQLDDMVAQLDKLITAAAQAPDEQRKVAIDIAAKVQPGIQELMNQALAKPGVAAVLKPTLDAFKSKLAALAAA